MPKLRDPRLLPTLLRSVVFATLPALPALPGCGDDGSTGAGAPDTRNCGMCGCDFNGTHITTVPYVPKCDDAGVGDAADASEVSDAAIDGSSEVGGSDASSDASGASDASDASCEEREPINCSLHCGTNPGAPGYGFLSTCRLLTGETGQKMVECTYVQPCGRRPAGLFAGGDSHAVDSVGRQLAEAAFLGQASVVAFEVLARELSAHGAPASLVRAARRAARDEVRHAQAMRGLSRRFGARPARPKTARYASRSLEAIARENAVEGCVRETYGAMLATWQGETAGDGGVRATMRRIAHDETRHAVLAWSLARWAERRLDRAARARLADARRAAVEALRAELATEPDAAMVKLLGMPRSAHALALVDGLFTERRAPRGRARARSRS